LSKPIYIYSTTGYDLFSLITPPRRYYFVKRLYISFSWSWLLRAIHRRCGGFYEVTTDDWRVRHLRWVWFCFVCFYYVGEISLLIMFGFLISVWLACFGRILHWRYPGLDLKFLLRGSGMELFYSGRRLSTFVGGLLVFFYFCSLYICLMSRFAMVGGGLIR